jgi:hypothetical protein
MSKAENTVVIAYGVIAICYLVLFIIHFRHGV